MEYLCIHSNLFSIFNPFLSSYVKAFFFILAYYHFTPISAPHQEVAAHKEFLKIGISPVVSIFQSRE